MLTSLETFRSRCGIQTTELDIHLDNALRAAQDEVTAHLGQPVERSTVQGTTTCVPHQTSDRHVAIVPASIDINLLTLYRDTDNADIAPNCSTMGNVIYLPYEEEMGTTYRYTLQSGWTQTSVPTIVTDVLYSIAFYLLLQTQLLQYSVAGLTSESRSETGVVTASRNYDENYVKRQLERLNRWRLLL
jgi:hypothetical protein